MSEIAGAGTGVWPTVGLSCGGDAVVFDRGSSICPCNRAGRPRPVRCFPRGRLKKKLYVRCSPTCQTRCRTQGPRSKRPLRVLGLHPRTLERRLSRWGASFESLLDEFRRIRSLQLIQQGTHSLTDIAFLVGYSDSAHFTRAFRRWTGSPPRDYVRGLRLSREFDTAKPRVDILGAFPHTLPTIPAK